MLFQCLSILFIAGAGASVVFRYSGDHLPSIGKDGEFVYPNLPGLIADDGKLSIRDKSLYVNSDPFKYTSPTLMDNAKYILYTKESFEIGTGKLTLQMTCSARIHGAENHPFGKDMAPYPNSDGRLGAALFQASEATSEHLYDFVITNNHIYALVEGSLKSYNQPDAVTGAYVIPLVEYLPLKEVTLAIEFDGTAQTVAWFVDGERLYVHDFKNVVPERYKVMQWGKRGIFPIPKKIVPGFGLSTGLQYYPIPGMGDLKGLVKLDGPEIFQNPHTGEPAEYYATSAEEKWRLWPGLGGEMLIKELVVIKTEQ
jgi:hypothetical protein